MLRNSAIFCQQDRSGLISGLLFKRGRLLENWKKKKRLLDIRLLICRSNHQPWTNLCVIFITEITIMNFEFQTRSWTNSLYFLLLSVLSCMYCVRDWFCGNFHTCKILILGWFRQIWCVLRKAELLFQLCKCYGLSTYEIRFWIWDQIKLKQMADSAWLAEKYNFPRN